MNTQRRRGRRLWAAAVSCALCVLLLPAAPGVPAAAAQETRQSEAAVSGRTDEYAGYLAAWAQAEKTVREIFLGAAEIQQSALDMTGGVQYEQDNAGRPALRFIDGGAVTFPVTVEEEGLYCLELSYRPMDSVIRDVEGALQIDGAYPFPKAESLLFPKEYDKTATAQDNRGHDIRPSSVVRQEWTSYTAADSTGIYGALLFHLKAGENRLTLSFSAGTTAVGALRFYNEPAAVTYETYRQAHADAAQDGGFSQTIEAEDATVRSSSVISLNMDRSGPDVSPNDPSLLKVNTLGGSGWAQPGQYAAWTVTVPRDGWYRLQLRYRQNNARGRAVYRRLLIDGAVPFQEAEALPFRFSDNWQTAWLGGEDPYWFYLKEGDREIRLETSLGSYTQVIARADETARDLGTLYREIVLITGQNTDANRDYMLAQELPDLPAQLQALNAALHEVERLLLAIDSRSLSDDAATVRTLYVQIQDFLEDTETIPLRMSSFQTNISSFSDFAAGLKKQPLELDCLAVASPDAAAPLTPPAWTQRVSYAVRAFLSSFTGDYASIGSVQTDGTTVDLWVNSGGTVGRDQAQILKQVIDSQFTPQTGIAVNLKLVQQALAPAIFSGRGPDVAAYIPTGDSVNLAARGGLQDLSGMEGFAEFTQEFSPDAFLPHTYNGGVYGVPFTEDFPVLFWRTDIFKQLGLEPPQTWEAFYDTLSVIQKNNMTVGIPNVQGSQMSTNNSIFAMLLYQRGGQYYRGDMTATAFDSEEALDAFRQWTDLYKNYSLPVQYSFYQRFRLGDMPMGIENYTMATMLQVAAPEIDGLWEMAPLPGVEQADGTVRRTAIAGGVSTIMLRSADNKEEGWQLIKWLSGAQAQTAIGIELEALLGPSGRFNPANHAAFENLPWNKVQARTIQAQWGDVAFLPQVPGGYYVDRNLTNAFRRTVFYSRNYREALLEYNREINLEITRKRREFGLDG